MKRDALESTRIFLTLPNGVAEKLEKLKPYYGVTHVQDVIRILVAEGLREKKWLP